MLNYQSMEQQRQRKCNLFGATNLVKPRRFDEAFEPYRTAFVLGNLQQQNFIINELVSSLISTESSKLAGERKGCIERKGCMEQETMASPLGKIFTCNLCQDLFHFPVTLVCGHTFCLQCLESYQRHDQTTCPSCGHESMLRYSSNIVIRELSQMWFPKIYELRNSIAEANKLLNKGKMEVFMEFTNNLVTKYPENIDILCQRANGYKSMKNYSEALRDLDFACSLAPFCDKVLYARGELLASLDDHEEAMTMFLRASALKPSNPTYRASLTLLLEILLRSICCSSIACSSNLSCKTELEFATKNVVKNFPAKPEVKFDESSTTTTQGMSERRQPRENFVEAERTDATYHRNESMKTNLAEKTDGILVQYTDGCCEAKEMKHNAKDQKGIFSSISHTTVSSTSSIPSELECNLCFKLIYQPVTTPCGHSLCQSCLRRCLDHRFDCPCCRTNLKGFMEYLMVGSVRTCDVLERILALEFNNDYQARRISYEKELSEFSRCESKTDEIPIFVCTLAAPSIVCPLHIFEPRYKLMIRRCMESGSRHFGMCVADPEQEFASVGTMLYINDIKLLPDGRSVVHTVGSKRFKVLERGLRDGYNTAKVAWLEDEYDDTDHTELNHQVFSMMARWFEKLPEEHKTCIVTAVGPFPDEHQGTSRDGPNWLWWLLVAMPLNLEAKRIILSMTSVTERLYSAKRFLAILLSRQ